MRADESSIIVFDGVCLLCSRWVDFILRHDRDGRFQLAAMQGRHGSALMLAHGLVAHDPSSFLLVQHGMGHTDTDAIIRILSGLNPRWRMLSWLVRAVPRALRNPAYRFLARHRYRLFGKTASCRLTDPLHADRFLD